MGEGIYSLNQKLQTVEALLWQTLACHSVNNKVLNVLGSVSCI